MKRLFLFMGILMFATNALYSQDKPFVPSETIIDRYLKSYSTEPEYKAHSLNEELMNSIRKNGVWGNPVFDKFMREIRLYQTLGFKSTKEHSHQIFDGIEAEMKKDQLYKPYLRLEKDGIGSYFYIRYNGDKIKEFAFITINADRKTFSVSSFNGDDINIDALRSFIPDK